MLGTCICAEKVWMNNKFVEQPPISFMLFCQKIGLFFLYGSVALAISESKGKYITAHYYFLCYFYEHVFVQNQGSSLKTASAEDSAMCSDGHCQILLKLAANIPLSQVGKKSCLNN